VAADDDLIQRPPLSQKSFNETEETGKMKDLIGKLWKDEEGQDLVEYALLAVLVSLGATAAMTKLASGISDTFSNAVAQLAAT
jgi:Flp pilus assembly pilin Flp